jgi:hypothetical protein
MFHTSLKRLPDDLKGKFTQFPHPNHPSLASLFARCYELYEIDQTKAPTIFFIQEGDHEAGGDLVINYAMKIIGAGRDKTFIRSGGLKIQGTKDEGERVVLQGITMKGSSGSGLYASHGLSFLCDSMTFTQCRYGVSALNTKGRLINCVITQCKLSGIYCQNNALIELEGSQTKIDGNGTSAWTSGYDYGLQTSYTSSIIHLLYPLTKESVSTNNHNGQNSGGGGTIQTVDSFAPFVGNADDN